MHSEPNFPTPLDEKTREIYIVEGGDLVDPAEPSNEVILEFEKALNEGNRAKLVDLIKSIDGNARNWGIAHGLAMANDDAAEVLFDGHLPVRLGAGDKGAIIGSAITVRREDIVTITINIGDSAGRDLVKILNSNWPAGLYFAMMRDLEKNQEKLAAEITEVVEKADG